jgi:carbohydrate diacid regulator
MVPEKKFLNQIESVFQHLMGKKIYLLDVEGNVLLPSEENGLVISLPEFLEPGMSVAYDNKTYLKIGSSPEMILCIPDRGGADIHNLILLAGEMIHYMGRGEAPIQSRYDVYRRMLRDELSGAEMEALSLEHQIEVDKERCVLTFQILQTEQDTAFHMLEELIPQDSGDILIDMDRHTAVVLKNMESVDAFEEVFQLAEAIEQTLLSEVGKDCVVGIGEPKKTFQEIGESYRESRRAVEVGRIFLPERHIYVYRYLCLERFLMDIPREMGIRYHHLLFNKKTSRLFNDEMLHTIEMFFEKDLNLSDTARQLYIHRNTLVYRLDKVQRLTGLDLRKFDDAVTFKMMMLLGKSGQDKPRPVY